MGRTCTLSDEPAPGGTGTEIFTVVDALYPVFQPLVTKIPTAPCTD
jgi:hypothetical protein